MERNGWGGECRREEGAERERTCTEGSVRVCGLVIPIRKIL